jgi:uncharacterized protein
MGITTLIMSIVVAWFVAQTSKAVVYKHKTLRFLFITGGMPSSHGAVMGALATGIYFIEGWSVLFVMSLVLTAIVAQDAVGVRRTVGLEGKILQQLARRKNITVPHFAQGHTPKQVLVGLIVGSIITTLFFFM